MCKHRCSCQSHIAYDPASKTLVPVHALGALAGNIMYTILSTCSCKYPLYVHLFSRARLAMLAVIAGANSAMCMMHHTYAPTYGSVFEGTGGSACIHAVAGNMMRLILYTCSCIWAHFAMHACTCSCGRGVYAGELAYDLGLGATPGFGLRRCLYLLHSTNLKVTQPKSAISVLSTIGSIAAMKVACRCIASRLWVR